MARLFGQKELEQRKRLLLAESEIYRQTFAIELYNLQRYAGTVRKSFNLYQALNPLLLISAPLTALLLRRRKPAPPGKLGMLLKGWQIYQKAAPFLRVFFERRRAQASVRAVERTRTSTTHI